MKYYYCMFEIYELYKIPKYLVTINGFVMFELTIILYLGIVVHDALIISDLELYYVK